MVPDYTVLLTAILERLDLIYTAFLLGSSAVLIIGVLFLLYSAVKVFLDH